MDCLVIPTRNNPVALAGLLSSHLALCNGGSDKPTLILCDGSDTPVTCDKHLSRLLTAYHLVYRHYLAPEVNLQRIDGLEQAEKLGFDRVLLVDDDHVLVSLGRTTPDYPLVAFGKCADLIADKGYKDFEQYGEPNEHHSLTPNCVRDRFVTCTGLATTANPGFCVLHPKFWRSLEELRCSLQPSAVVDDTWAVYLASLGNNLLDTHMQAFHIGNSNNWWNQGEIKKAAVRLAGVQLPRAITSESSHD